ncbi:ABC transporter permease [Chitinimonas sp. BJB300]|uniref:ABC transporter permease n=1 Tax=Chitinimonas sp. BJB300 TaxID=1559339 RepID=UPI000C0F9575|nr:ABC transporter permease [Chitinimonas sp. BJB300]PHV10926.1 multidrug ABC transporter permease [Chitinimonas sp. BJB300]TSJ89942.1 ABC transporter permease [Chitinimonas sp. BJB300]
MRLSRIPLHYVWRNLFTRKLTTVLTAGGMALVVFVFATVLMLEAGLKQTLTATGLAENVVAIRKGSQTEIQSGLSRQEASIIESSAPIALNAMGRQLSSREAVVLISLQKKGGTCSKSDPPTPPCTNKPANIVVRGVGAQGLAIRPQAKLIEGRRFLPGSAEIMVGRAIADGFEGVQLGASLHFARRDWTVVGIFDAGKTGFNSEIWGDAEQMMQAFRRLNYSALVFQLRDTDAYASTQKKLEADQRLTAEYKRETQFYADQSKVMASFISILGSVLSAIFSVGAIIGAMITMYAAVANRTGEIGTLRALGYRRRSVMLAFLLEALFLALLGGVVGLILASFMQFFAVSTMNWQTFAELAFSFTLTPIIVLKSLLFALLMGMLGGFLPALRAARLQIVDALRAA